jgi:chitinase
MLMAALTILCAVGQISCGGSSSSAPPAPQPIPAPAAGPKPFAPYIDTSLNPNLPQIQASSSIKYFTLAFIVDGGGCSANWDGATPVSSDSTYTGYINAIRAGGGDVVFSFGGAAGDNLPTQGAYQGSNDAPDLDLAYSNDCATASALTSALQTVINQYGANPANNTIYLDFDVEGNAVNSDAGNGPTRTRTDGVDSVDLRNQALTALVANNPGITINVSYTMGVYETGGLPQDQISVLQNALDNSTPVAVMNIMTFDFGPDEAIAPGSYAPVVENLANQTLTQLSEPPLSALGAQLGITLMIGVNDSPGEVFGLSDAQAVTAFATPNADIVRLSFWSVGRDTGGCPGSDQDQNTCSGIEQFQWDFSHTCEAF